MPCNHPRYYAVSGVALCIYMAAACWNAAAQTTPTTTSTASATTPPAIGEAKQPQAEAKGEIKLTPEQELEALRLRIDQLEKEIKHQPSEAVAPAIDTKTAVKSSSISDGAAAAAPAAAEVPAKSGQAGAPA